MRRARATICGHNVYVRLCESESPHARMHEVERQTRLVRLSQRLNFKISRFSYFDASGEAAAAEGACRYGVHISIRWHNLRHGRAAVSAIEIPTLT